MKPSSLRARLTLIILPPLLIISLIAGAWQFHNTTLRAESIFDKGLLSAAIAISRDVALSDGDAISPSTVACWPIPLAARYFIMCLLPTVCLSQAIPPHRSYRVWPPKGPQILFTTTVSIRAKMCGFCASKM